MASGLSRSTGKEIVEEQWRGTLYPTRLPTFHRLLPPDRLLDRVRWIWLPEWHLPPGRVSRQELLPFPALNLVIQAEGVMLSGPATRRSFRDLSGRGWAVGLLLRPAAVPAFTEDPGALRDAEVPFPAPELHAAVREVMASGEGAGGDEDGGGDRGGEEGGGVDGRRRARATEAAASWLESRVPEATADGRLANRMEELIQADPALIRVDQVAGQLGVSVRTLQRLARRHVGLSPLAMIRRYRLQEAVERLRSDPGVTIADVAADVGYADHAHLASVFRDVLGFTPSGYRRSSNGEES